MSFMTAVRDVGRLRQISQVLIRHGFGELVTRMGISSGSAKDDQEEKVGRPELGERIRLVLQDLGPTFVKLGQILSTRSDIIPEDILLELKKLQDDVPPFSEEEARHQIETTLGFPVETIFSSFSAEPIASASVAQVHQATLQVEGVAEPILVAVKIQRPGIVEKVQGDLDLLYLLARMIERAMPETRFFSLPKLVREFDQAISAELDFTLEATHARRFADNFKDDPSIRFPKVFPQASGKRVITLEFLDGLKLDRAVSAGADAQWIANTAVRLILKMIFEDGFFHADPHPGNVLILPRPDEESYQPNQPIVIGMLDLGLVGRLSPELRDRSVDLLLAAAENNPEGIADAMLAIGRSRKKVDRVAFQAYVSSISERHLGRALKDLDVSAIVRDILGGAAKFEIEVPMELTMMLRAIMTIEGVGKEVYPDLDILPTAKPFLAKIIMQRFHPLRLGTELLQQVGRLGGIARDMPYQLQEILEDLRQGRLSINTADPEGARATEMLGKRIRSAAISVALLGAGTAFVLSRSELRSMGWGLMIGAGVWFVIHLVADFFSGRRPMS
jgi:ubiquinone biosynthesis protein